MRRVGVAVLILALVGGAWAGGQNSITSAGYIPVDVSTCWDCHRIDDIRDMAEIVPIPVTIPIDETAGFSVQFQNAWLTYHRVLQPSLDISEAPSIGFASGKAPTTGVWVGTSEGGTTPISQNEGHVVVQIPTGATDINIIAQPENQDPLFGPDISMELFANADEPSSSPDFGPIDESRQGSAERFRLQGGQEISDAGYGNWTVQLTAQAAGGPNVQPGALVPFDFQVTVNAFYNLTGETLQFLGVTPEPPTPPGGLNVATWDLVALSEPGPNEELTLRLNLTSQYIWNRALSNGGGGHNSDDPDWAYTYQELKIPVGSDGGVSIGETTTTVVKPVTTSVTPDRISEVIGYVAAFLIIASVYTGGMFGKASRRQLNKVFGSAKRRVAFHNFLSYGIIAAALAHTIIFVWHWPNFEARYHWTVGMIWGNIAIAIMLGLGVTGAMQVPMIRRWNYAVWRWAHLGLSFAVILFTVVHILLDGGNFGELQQQIGWDNPFEPELE